MSWETVSASSGTVSNVFGDRLDEFGEPALIAWRIHRIS